MLTFGLIGCFMRKLGFPIAQLLPSSINPEFSINITNFTYW